MKGSPGAILALAIGAVFLALGWNGRYAAVWEAIRTGESNPISGGGTIINDTNENPDAVAGNPGDWVYVTIIGGANAGQQRAMKYEDVQAGTQPNRDAPRCPVGSVEVEVRVSGTEWDTLRKRVCVPGTKLYPVTSGAGQGGQVVTADDTTNVMPNGVMAITTQPNAIGYFDHD